MKITSFNQKACQIVAQAAEDALAKVAQEYGLMLKKEKGGYTAASFTAKFTFDVVTESGVPAQFLEYCALFNLMPEDFGREFTRQDKQRVKIIGLLPRRPKFPIHVQNVVNGEKFLITEKEAVRLLHPEYSVQETV